MSALVSTRSSSRSKRPPSKFGDDDQYSHPVPKRSCRATVRTQPDTEGFVAPHEVFEYRKRAPLRPKYSETPLVSREPSVKKNVESSPALAPLLYAHRPVQKLTAAQKAKEDATEELVQKFSELLVYPDRQKYALQRLFSADCSYAVYEKYNVMKLISVHCHQNPEAETAMYRLSDKINYLLHQDIKALNPRDRFFLFTGRTDILEDEEVEIVGQEKEFPIPPNSKFYSNYLASKNK